MMTTLSQKVKLLGDAGKYDLCSCRGCQRPAYAGTDFSDAIYKAVSVEGRQITLFKALMSNDCAFDCKYCRNASGCNRVKESFTPKEYADIFGYLTKKRYVEGLFISSAITKSPDRVTEDMLDAVKMIRQKHGFRGYIHFKILPGTRYELVKQASELADRLSVNIEAPSTSRMSELSSVKDFKIDILRRQLWIKRLSPGAGQTTQMVVGCGSETDLEVLKRSNWEYTRMELKRVYYSGFIPAPGTPTEGNRGCDHMRTVRLYNSDFLIRDYGYKLNEIKEIMDGGFLPRHDPKMALARLMLDRNIDINEAGFNELIRVPGVGPKSARRIVSAREKKRIQKMSELRELGVVTGRAAPFLRIGGSEQKRLCAF